MNHISGVSISTYVSVGDEAPIKCVATPRGVEFTFGAGGMDFSLSRVAAEKTLAEITAGLHWIDQHEQSEQVRKA
ncbi:hypothetical protein [Actinosynnema sp. NPDC020468]|uniref:hypothetical protein n=1 Tax=Actinosynnema sp. NPDC020468 TaxID=3154488 RepID=UPI0033D2145B